MYKKLLVSLLSVLVLSTTVAFADDTITTNTRPEPPQFENGIPPELKNGTGVNDRPDFIKGQHPQGQPPQINGERVQNGQFDGRPPSKKPDNKPGGDRKPPEWDNSSDNGQRFQGKQPPQFDKNGRSPKPPKEENTDTTTE